jgi:CIC family chloride channel protein
VIAGLTASELFGQSSLFVTMLRAGGLDYDTSPVFQALRRTGVASVMERRVSIVGPDLTVAKAKALLEAAPVYLLVEEELAEGRRRTLMPAVALAAYVEDLSVHEDGEHRIPLDELPAQRWQVGRIDLQATLQEAWQRFEEDQDEALVVERVTAPGISRSYGVLLPDMVERAYRF